MIPNKKHQIFADEFKLTNGLTEDAIRCYQIAYPNTQKESARVKSSKLLQDVTVKKYIQDYKENLRLERENSVINAIKKESSSNVLQREKALEMVSNVAKIMYNKIAKENKTADVMAFNSTIERLSKMDGWDKPTKQEQTIIDKRQGVVDFEIE